MGANCTSGQELQIAAKNRFRANFFGYPDKVQIYYFQPFTFYLLIGQDFNMSHRCDRLGSLLPRWTSGYGITLIILFFLDQVARVGQWTTRLPYLKIRTSRYGMSRSLVSILGILGRHVTPLWHVVSMKNYCNFAVSGTFWKYLVHDGSKLVAFKVAPRPELRPAIMYCELVKRRSYFWVNFSSFCT